MSMHALSILLIMFPRFLTYRGNIMSQACCWFGKKMLLIFNGGTGEVAKIATPFKLFAIKRHLDDFLSSARYLDESDVTEVKLPIVPIMCVTGYLHGLHSNTTPTESDLTSLIKSILLNTLAVI
ncbi:hypothetical protein BDF21DRAFT_399147 [Thamnidium elegans]|nr:hypothetical protein BDF21DRAFT_399147 [Thamnidium elegans]